ncbi:nitrogenase component 1 [Clostridium sp. LP20]|uniref:nitrogenase component 1 n=1 Tax=Clostridium sp. LP20 TaxID=3418665 RepID=UPI003EE533F0
MNYSLDILNRLSEINVDKDIKGLSHAIFPGTHCPLFGVALTASYVENLAMLVVGTSECTYYTRIFSNNRQKGNDNVYSLVLKEKDVVFGAEKSVREALEYIKESSNPDGIMIVTTCVPELIGEDYEGIVDEVEDELNIPIFVVRTEHYKCNSHIPGMVRALGSFVKTMKSSKELKGINILGHRQEGVKNTELVKLLDKHNIEINTIIPSKCKVSEIQLAPRAKLNIVTDMIALDLAKKMEKEFKTPYIFFDKHMNKEAIESAYKKLEKVLEIDLTSDLKEIKEEYEELFEKTRKILGGKSFVYGNTPMMAFETAEFLVELGLEPKLIQVRELYDVDVKWKDRILELGFDPYVTRIANIAPLRELYDSLNVELYVGHENPMLLKSKGIMQVTLDSNAQKIGYELPIGIMKTLIEKAMEG